MALVRLSGGLGNQMFQYAAALTLAKRSHSLPKVDTSWFLLNHRAIGCTPRSYELDQFEGVKVDQVKMPRSYSHGMRIIRHCSVLRDSVFCRRRFMLEASPFKYDRKFEKLTENAILDGYFQAVNYLDPIATTLRQIFIPKNCADALFRSILAMAESENTVAIHVRRGDYISNVAAAAAHRALESAYYQNAISAIGKRIVHKSLLFFSDDLDWCRKTFSDLDGAMFMDTYHLNSAQVLYLMSRCSHQVIANSSFSWWAGWLNPRAEKCVFMPRRWTTDLTTRDTDLVYDQCIVL